MSAKSSFSTLTGGGDPERPQHYSRWRWLALLAVLFLLSLPVQAATLTLTWNPVTGTNISYRVYSSVGASAFSLTLSALTTNRALVSFDSTVTTRWYVTAFSPAYQITESEPSNVWTNSPPIPPLAGLTFEAESGTITPPFFINGTVVQQDTQSGATDGGRASYTFTITNAGAHIVTVMVNAPSGEPDSFFANIDAEPTESTIWDVPVTSGVQERKVQWRGETVPHQFILSAAQHTLIIRGREPGAQLDRISIAPVSVTPPTPIPGPPPTPSGLRATQVQAKRYDLGWSSLLTAVTEVERSILPGPFQRIETVAAGTQHTTTQVKPSVDYAFRVRSVNSAGASPYSNTVIVDSR